MEEEYDFFEAENGGSVDKTKADALLKILKMMGDPEVRKEIQDEINEEQGVNVQEWELDQDALDYQSREGNETQFDPDREQRGYKEAVRRAINDKGWKRDLVKRYKASQ